MATTVEQVETALATMGGELKAEIASLRGDVQTLTAELRLDREARARADAEHARVHADQELRIRALEERRTITAMQLWSVVLGAIGGLVGVVAIFNALAN